MYLRKRGNTMANQTLFASIKGALIPQTDIVNSENAPA
jgi:hypothetical protein